MPSLDQGPPLPPNMQAQPPQANMGQLAGGQAPQPTGSSQESMINAMMGITEDLLPKLQQALINIGDMSPEAQQAIQGMLPMVQAFTDKFKQTLTPILMKGAAPPSAGQLAGAPMMGAGAPMAAPQ